MDIIDFALDKFTDYTKFEQLASEILRNEGYPNIKPLGGVYDYGQDAIVENLYQNAAERIVFQFSIEKKTYKKIIDTIDKLKTNEVQFSFVVYVTTIKLTTKEILDLKKESMTRFNIKLEIFERGTLHNRLSDSSNKIFLRYFPDVEKQILAFRSDFSSMNLTGGKKLETEMIKTSLAFVFNASSHSVRKSIFDNIIIAILHEAYPLPLKSEEIKDKINKELNIVLADNGQIDSSLHRLCETKFIDCDIDKYCLKKQKHKEIEFSSESILSMAEVLVDDITAMAIDSYGSKVSDDTERRLKRNTREVLSLYFSAYGTEISTNLINDNTLNDNFQDFGPTALDTCMRDIDSSLGNVLFSSIGSVIAAPTREQIESFYYWMMAYVGKSIINVDPNLKEFQLKKFSLKTFVLDTDFVINCICKDIESAVLYNELISSLISLSAKVIIPKSVVDECVLHAKYSYRTYNYFKMSLLSVPESMAEEKINNAFVRGYYCNLKKTNNIQSFRGFQNYLANYYDKNDSYNFMLDVIKTSLPENILIIDNEDITSATFDDDELKDVTKIMFELISSSRKGKYRSDDENRQFAMVDATLYLKIKNANLDSNGRSIFGLNYYLLSDSNRYKYVSRLLHSTISISSNARCILNILSIIGKSSVHKLDIVKLMENPFIIYSTKEVWDDVEKLIKSGIDLSTKSLPRLRRDLDSCLHDLIKNFDKEIYFDEKRYKEFLKSNDYDKILNEASKLGYAIDPAIKALKEKADEKDTVIQGLNEQLKSTEITREELEKIGKRKRRYLRRIQKKR